MSARKIGSVSFDHANAVTVEARQVSLTLSPESVVIRRGGIQFRSAKAFAKWVEMTVALQPPTGGARVNCSGVVVDCSGDRHNGYTVSMIFTGLTKQAEMKLAQMATAGHV
ncbi:MAG: hypothetical protein EPO07_02745 [Verrucomicrobia bacterium]|nr:MAG: hypothetical protein EPO07_02745 [Verrucomicrobiota bacterium]